AYTLDDLKCYKGLEAYNQFNCGWVSGISTAVIDKKHVVKAKVLQSQRLREKTLNPRFIAEGNGKVLSSHCDCMAGLGKSCTHVAALLFAVNGTVQIRNSRTVTQEPAYWLLPTSLKGVTYNEVRNIDFSAAKTLKKRFSIDCDNVSTAPLSQSAKTMKRKTPAPTDNELQSFLFVKFSFNRCNDLNIEVSKEEEVSNVEKITKKQSEENLWYDFRAGRITASKIKYMHVTLTQPDHGDLLSSKKQIIKLGHKGLSKEKVARSTLLNILIGAHENVELEDSDLCISTDLPHVAASPDGVIACDCCGRSCV
ncbi:LOW QUALITY PROTEIN: hypothetical protein MAR_030558, partial [Mya arenaria]